MILEETYFSIGGGFVVQEEQNFKIESLEKKHFPFPIERAKQLEYYCHQTGLSISEIVVNPVL